MNQWFWFPKPNLPKQSNYDVDRVEEINHKTNNQCLFKVNYFFCKLEYIRKCSDLSPWAYLTVQFSQRKTIIYNKFIRIVVGRYCKYMLFINFSVHNCKH
jgi:hypothetical protein